MKYAIGKRELEWGTELIELTDSSDLLAQPEALQQRMQEDGYLFIRGMHDREKVLRARRKFFEYVENEGACIMPGTDFMDGIANPKGRMINTLGHKAITHAPEFLDVLESPKLLEFFATYFGEDAMTFDFKWLRAVSPGGSTGFHYDNVYMGRGSDRLVTCWTPFGDIPIEHGTLAVCAGSHQLEGFDRLRKTYGQMDVDRDHVVGWFSDDPLEVTEKFGGQWATANVEAGDVIIIGMHTMHGSTNNTTNRWRLSCDTRFQPAADPADERWIGENPKAHYGWMTDPTKIKQMNVARAEWGV